MSFIHFLNLGEVVCPWREFYPAVPIKDWEFIFNLHSIDGSLIELDASGWEYILLEYPDKTFEIILKAPPLMELSVDDRIIAAEILLDGAIGEEIRIENIGFIDIVIEFEQEYKDRSSPIKVIEKHFAAISQKTKREHSPEHSRLSCG